MKEATGELNLTIIVVIAVALLVAFFYYTIWPSLDNNFKANSNCNKAYCDSPCDKPGENYCPDKFNTLVTCHIKDSDITIQCPWKG